MKLRKIEVTDTLLIPKAVKKTAPRSRFRKPLEWILIFLLLITAYRYFGTIKVSLVSDFISTCDYLKSCIADVFRRPLWQILLLFAPALVFDVGRYYLTNTFVFFRDIFKRKPRDEFDKSGRYPLVSVLIPVYNESEIIRKTLDSILESDYPNFEIIVVDDCSKDTTGLICKEYERKGLIRYLRKEQRSSKPGALNYGFKFAKGEYIVHFDADIVVYRDAIRQGIKPFKDPKVGVVSGNLRVCNDRQSLAARMQAAEYAICISVQRRWLAFTNSLHIASGAFSILRREVLEKSRGVDPETGEDLDITLKAKKMGYKIAFAPRAIAMTNVPNTFYGLFRQRIRWNECYIRISLRKHGNIANLRRFAFSDFYAVMSDILYNLVLMAIFPIYILLVIIFVPQLFLFILAVTYLFYLVMYLWQFIITTVLSDDPLRDAIFILYAPLFFMYSLFLRGVRAIAYTLEFFRLKYLRDGFFPKQIWDSMPRY